MSAPKNPKPRFDFEILPVTSEHYDLHETIAVIRGWAVHPFRTIGFCWCGKAGETFIVSSVTTGGDVVRFGLCGVCVDDWTTTQPHHSRRRGAA